MKKIYDKLSKKLKYLFISMGLIFLMIIWSLLITIILKSFGIYIDNLSSLNKTIIAFISDILFLLLLIKIYYKDIKKDFTNFFNKKFFSNIKTSISYWIIGLIIMIISNSIIAIITNGNIADNEEVIRILIDNYPLYMAFTLMIYAPLCEEIIFRKSIYNITKNKYLYIFLSGFIFGGLHVVSSITSPIDLLYLIPYCSLGFTFAFIYKKTNNIFSTITAHAIHNTLALILYIIGA